MAVTTQILPSLDRGAPSHGHDHGHSHSHSIDFSADGTLIDRTERFILAARLSLALAALCLLVVAGAMHLFLPSEEGISNLVAGAAAALVAVPVLIAAWDSLRHPSLHGITDRLVALALVAAWATGDMVTAALLPTVRLARRASTRLAAPR